MNSRQNTKITRRRFFHGSAALGVGAAASFTNIPSGNADVDVSFANDFKGPVIPFVDQYYDGLLEIARGTRDESVGTIAKAMEKAYECIQNGGKIYCRLQTGHFVMFAGSSDLPGQPNLLPNTRGAQGNTADMKKGDFYITNGSGSRLDKIRNSGAYVVGITCNYSKFSKTPSGFLRSDTGPAIEDVCELVIDSHVPYYNGLVNAPQIPGFQDLSLEWYCDDAGVLGLHGITGESHRNEGKGFEHGTRRKISRSRHRTLPDDRNRPSQD